MLLVKVGGGTNLNQSGIIANIKALVEPVVFVHGANVQRDQLAQNLGHATKRITAPSGVVSVLTDQEALDIMLMAYSGLVNKRWVEAFQKQGVNAIGLSGVDGRIWQGVRKKHLLSVENGKEKLITNTFTGKVESINSQLLELLLEQGYLPVLTQPAVSSEGELINTDNDINVSLMAGALKAKQLVVLFEAPGLLKDHTDPKSLIPKVSREQLSEMMQYAKGTMKKKVMGAIKALELGVETIYWGDSRTQNPVADCLAGKGTIIQ